MLIISLKKKTGTMINCSLILKKDKYCPHMQETPLLLSLTDTAFVSLRGFMFCFLFMLFLSASFFFSSSSSVVHPHRHASHHSVSSAWSSVSSRYFSHRTSLLTYYDWIPLQSLPHVEGHNQLRCLLWSGSVLLAQLRTIEWKLYGDILVGLSED